VLPIDEEASASQAHDQVQQVRTPTSDHLPKDNTSSGLIPPLEALNTAAQVGLNIRRHIRDYTTLIDDKTRDFVGRGFVLDEIDAFLRTEERGYFFVVGDPGIGKSSLAAHLVKTRGYIHHFNIQSEGINRAEVFLANVCAQLIVRHSLKYEALPPNATLDAGVLNQLLRDAATAQRSTDKLVIVVDALDEVDRAGVSTGANALYLPTSLPSGVFFIITTRRTSDMARLDCEQQSLEIGHDSPQNLHDIKEYALLQATRPGVQSYIHARQISTGTFVDLMVEKSEGNFAYLRYVFPEVENGAYRNLDEDAIPVGLQGYYDEHWRRMRTASEVDWFAFKLPVIVALTAVRKPVSLDLLCEFSRVPERTRVQTVLMEFRQFLHEVPVDTGQAKPERRFRVYHSSYHDYLKSKEEVAAECFDLKAAQRRIVESLLTGLRG
jgi:hypothetical protein